MSLRTIDISSAYRSNSYTPSSFISELEAQKNKYEQQLVAMGKNSSQLNLSDDIKNIKKNIEEIHNEIIKLKNGHISDDTGKSDTYQTDKKLLNRVGDAYAISISKEGYMALNSGKDNDG